MVCKLIVIANTIISIVLANVAWDLKLCLNGIPKRISSSVCSSGVWLREYMHVPSVCLSRGVWAIYEDWCSEYPIVLYINEMSACYAKKSLEGQITGIFYLGDDYAGVSIATSNLRLFLNSQSRDKQLTWKFLNPTLEVVTWGPETSYLLTEESVGKSHCLQGDSNSSIHFYTVPLSDIENMTMSLAPQECRHKTEVNILTANENLISQGNQNNNNKKMRFECNKDEIFPDIETTERVELQSKRIALKFLAQRFGNRKMPEMLFDEWEFLELSKDAFKTACPENLIDSEFLDTIFILFQHVLLESFKVFPPVVDSSTTDGIRIKKALELCFGNAEPFDLIKLGGMDECSPNSFPYALDSKNTSSHIPLVLPKAIRMNIEKFDLILEAVWKITLFTHYYCSEFFLYPADLSLLHTRWQSLLAPDLMERWLKPGDSIKVMQVIFRGVPLLKTLRNIDTCVAAAHSLSSYKGWMKRPKTKYKYNPHRYNEGNDKDKKPIWNGQAYCMDDFKFPAVKLGYPLEKCGITLSA